MKPPAEHRSILLVEDEPAIARGTTRGLEVEGFEVRWVESAEDALKTLAAGGVDLIILDVRLPGMDGFTFCRTIRADRVTVPVIMVTARDEEIDRVLGLEIGADDYLVKPFSLRELVSRVRAHLRRAYGELSSAGAPIEWRAGSIRIDRKALRVFREGVEVVLTPTEMKLLLSLVDNAEIALSRSALIDHAWGEGYVLEDERTVDVHIRHLREKLEEQPDRPTLIQTVRGYGYRLVVKP